MRITSPGKKKNMVEYYSKLAVLRMAKSIAEESNDNGAADSIDKERRMTGISWWPEELPSIQDAKNADINLNKCDNKVDFILTHTAPRTIIDKLGLDNWYSGIKLVGSKGSVSITVIRLSPGKIGQYEKLLAHCTQCDVLLIKYGC